MEKSKCGTIINEFRKIKNQFPFLKIVDFQEWEKSKMRSYNKRLYILYCNYQEYSGRQRCAAKLLIGRVTCYIQSLHQPEEEHQMGSSEPKIYTTTAYFRARHATSSSLLSSLREYLINKDSIYLIGCTTATEKGKMNS